MMNLRQASAKGGMLVGTFCAIPHPVAIEVTAASGLDFLCIDWEHSQIDRERIEDLVRASDVHGVPAMVRVPGHAPESIAAALDAGARGVLVPRVGTADQARQAVEATRYPPHGTRGVGPGRAAGYGYGIPDYLARANDTICLAVQVETAEGLANIEDIAQVEGIDVIFIGPGDLSVSLGAMGPAGKDRLHQAIDQIAARSLAAGKAVGIFRPDATDAGEWAAKGISFFVLASDTMFMGASAANAASDMRNNAKGGRT